MSGERFTNKRSISCCRPTATSGFALKSKPNWGSCAETIRSIEAVAGPTRSGGEGEAHPRQQLRDLLRAAKQSAASADLAGPSVGVALGVDELELIRDSHLDPEVQAALERELAGLTLEELLFDLSSWQESLGNAGGVMLG